MKTKIFRFCFFLFGFSAAICGLIVGVYSLGQIISGVPRVQEHISTGSMVAFGLVYITVLVISIYTNRNKKDDNKHGSP